MKRCAARAIGPVLTTGVLVVLVASCATTPVPEASRPATADAGYVTSDMDRFMARLYSDSESIEVEGQSGDKIPVPPGTYRIGPCGVQRKDASGAYWSAAGSGVASKTLTINANETTSLPLGPPFKVLLQTGRSGSEITFGVTIEGRGGERYAPGGIYRGRERPQAPGVIIKDASGKTVAEGRFRYG